MGGLYISAIPLFESWISNLNLNSFTPEHTIYPFEDDLVNYFNQFGFQKISSEIYLDHSLFICFKNCGQLIEPIKSSNKVTLLENFQKNLNGLSNFIQKIAHKHKRIVLWGANSSTQLILNFVNRIEITENFFSVVDNSELKIGGYLFGTNIQIESPQTITSLSKEDAVIVMLGTFDDEVKKQCSLINPRVQVYDKFMIFN